ncbi:hypothetical protein B0H19DRAFT_1061649 [Mycena capillaripes]|nr:hypothetical protein B0H19DRAFT_1061649 [Mycena capillaripes]
MLPQPTVTQIRLSNITMCLGVTANTLKILTVNLKTPFLATILNTTVSLLNHLQTAKQNKNTCIRLMEQTYELLNGLISLHIKSAEKQDFPPDVLNHIGKLTETLHKIHTFLEAQQNGSRFKKFFQVGQMSTLLKECEAGLQQGLDFFQIKTVSITTDIAEMQQNGQKRQEEVLDMIEAMSDTTTSDRGSFVNGVYSSSFDSSNSVSMVPSAPKIFHGRESELAAILKLFSLGSPSIAILGAATKVELAALIGAHLGLKLGKDLTRPVIQHFSSGPPCLLILDNLETLWEPTESRGDIEEFLSLLTDVDHLGLLITMRGAERPAKLQWTHPFLPPIKPLKQEAARQTFIDIADDQHDLEDIDKILTLTPPIVQHLAGSGKRAELSLDDVWVHHGARSVWPPAAGHIWRRSAEAEQGTVVDLFISGIAAGVTVKNALDSLRGTNRTSSR